MIFFPFHIEIEGKGGWIMGGGVPKGYVGPPSHIIGEGGLAPPPPTPTVFITFCFIASCVCIFTCSLMMTEEIVNICTQNGI